MGRKILVIGDYETSHWHPLGGVDDRLKGILASDELTCTDSYGNLTVEQLRSYDALMCYVDSWNDRGSRASAGAILEYVAGDAGRLLYVLDWSVGF